MNFLGSIQLDSVSYWIGFITGALFFWLLGRVMPVFRQLAEVARYRAGLVRSGLTTGAEERYRADLLKLVQTQHLAAPICALDDILIQPRIIPPPPTVEPNEDIPSLEKAEEILPYLPDWPEVAAVYRVYGPHPEEFMVNQPNLLILGRPGMGKTTTLCYLASKLARRDPTMGALAHALPVFLNIKEVILPLPPEQKPFDALYNLVSSKTSALALPRLPQVLKEAFQIGRVVLLVDGLDEMAQPEIQGAQQFLAGLRAQYPLIKIVAAGAPQYIDGLQELGLTPVSLKNWTDIDRRELVERWEPVWHELALAQPINPYSTAHQELIRSWLKSSNPQETPLETTLRIWSAFAGDALGASGDLVVEAYLRRLQPASPHRREALVHLARRFVLSPAASLPRRDVLEILKEYEPQEIPPEEPPIGTDGKAATTPKTRVPSGTRLMNEFLRDGFLFELQGERVTFSHPVILAYLAGGEPVSLEELDRLLLQPDWSAKFNTLKYLTSRQDLSMSFASEFAQTHEPLYRNLLEMGHILQLSDPAYGWVKQLLRLLLEKIQDPYMPMVLRGQFVASLAGSREPAMTAVFRKLMSHTDPTVRQLGALGAGLLGDGKATSELKNLLADAASEVSQTACLALGALNTAATRELVTSALLHGEEELRICAAEVLANDEEEGHAMLREGIAFDDLLVRRAVVNGLGRIHEAWSWDLLEKLRLDDPQWVVRNAAEQVLSKLRDEHISAPRAFPSLMNTPWLIEFASKRGVGISSEQAGLEMLLTAAKEGDEREKYAALERMANVPGLGAESILPLYHALYGAQAALRERAYLTLWQLSGTGMPFPEPMQYGFA